MFISGANNLENNKDHVNQLNVFPVPDGDTGTNMSLTMNSAVREINDSEENSAYIIAELAANGSLMGARGNSGVILSQILRGISKALKNEEEMNCLSLAKAFMEGSHTAYKAVMKPTEGTILTVIRESAEYGLGVAKQSTDLIFLFKEIVRQANITLEKTPEMLPVLKQANVVDAGGKGLIDILNGMLYYLTTKEIIQVAEKQMDVAPSNEILPFEEDIKFGYCTEFLIKGKSMNLELFKKEIMNMGDSLIVVGDESLLKVHIHTNNPGRVIEKGIEFGYLSSIKIDNMREQHQELLVNEEDKHNSLDNKKFGVVTVAIGTGISNIFKDLGADEVIEGGQTMNPSTEDIYKSVQKIKAENIIILPNNGNVILAASQVKHLTDKSIIVAKTKTIPQGIAAIMAIDPDKTPEENEKKIERAISDVKTGLITYAVRDSNYNGLEIEEGNIIGMIDNEINSYGDNISTVINEILDAMVDDDSSLITIYYGVDVIKDEAEELLKDLQNKYLNCDVEYHYGGQPLYYYILSVE
ncbi:MAG: DAK2 domain-containing protein [Firmicutes bacterium]|nr:DAK2 domain-containing protein [Bacillota bacterium]